ncbi:hypothetical protein BT69DRAFT_1347031 [Atractiella rhizophila]|nr:hypothetical protein BT69DRAFT_1347031 [Atractiella rhizophila]
MSVNRLPPTNSTRARSGSTSRPRPSNLSAASIPPPAVPPTTNGSLADGSSSTADFLASDEALLKAYRLSSLEPAKWEDVQFGGADDMASGGTGAGGENTRDPLGLTKSSILANIPKETDKKQILSSSKNFDPKVFLSTVHPNASFADLARGRERLREVLDSRTEALQTLVEKEWDRFVSVKGATQNVIEEMNDLSSGPLAPGQDAGVRNIRESLSNANEKASLAFQPILDARLKAERLRSTLGVFERSKFFFNLPGVIREGVDSGRYDTALTAYKKGRYLMESRPGMLIPFGAGGVGGGGAEGRKRVFDKVWSQVEGIVGDLKKDLGARLRDPRCPIEEVERTIEILLELDPNDQPVWIFLDTQNEWILSLLKKTEEVGRAKFAETIDKDGREMDEAFILADLQGVLEGREEDMDRILETGRGSSVWKAAYAFTKDLSDVMLHALPTFLKVARGYTEGKYQKKNLSSTSTPKRSATQCKSMTYGIITLYVTLISNFFSFSSSSSTAPPDSLALPYIPSNSSALMTAHWTNKILRVLSHIVSESNGGDLVGEPTQLLKELLESARSGFLAVIASSWTRDSGLLTRMEDWEPDADEGGRSTTNVKLLVRFEEEELRFCGSIFGKVEKEGFLGRAERERREEVPIPPALVAKSQKAFLDSWYNILEGIGQLEGTEEVDLDKRLLLSMCNLEEFQEKVIPKLAEKFHEIFKHEIDQDLDILLNVVKELSDRLFNDYVESKRARIEKIITVGVLEDGIDWLNTPKPTEVHPFIYSSLLSLVLIHAQVSGVTPTLVNRVLERLVYELATITLTCFSKVEAFGMGGMLQATLEIEFIHQTLPMFMTPKADETLQKVYATISAKKTRQKDSGAELQKDLEGLKKVLSESRKNTMLQFLAFKKPKGDREGNKG